MRWQICSLKPSTASAGADGVEKAVDKPPCRVYHDFTMTERRYTAAQRNKTIILLRASTGTEARRRSCRGRSGQRSGWQGKLLCFLLFPLRTQQNNRGFVALGGDFGTVAWGFGRCGGQGCSRGTSPGACPGWAARPISSNAHSPFDNFRIVKPGARLAAGAAFGALAGKK